MTTDETSLAIQTSRTEEVDLSRLTRENVLAGVDEAIRHLYETGSVQYAVNVLNAFGKFEDMSGIARAKMLWGSRQWFKDTHQEGDFYEKFGITEKNNRTYTDRLIRMWDCIQDERVPKAIQKRTVRELMPITEALSQGYDISAEIWRKLEQAIDADEIRAIIQEKVKDKETRSHTIKLTVDSKGTIYAYHKEKRYFIGSLNMTERDNPAIDKAITRIIDAARIKEV